MHFPKDNRITEVNSEKSNETPEPEPFTQPHYKNKTKAESFSKKGFGIGFVSKVDRFSTRQDSILTMKDRLSKVI